jgi:nucleoside-diphosphate-sugar epimerase
MKIKGKVLVTGGAGLVGSRLVRALVRQGCKVRVLDMRYGELDGEKADTNLEFSGIGGDSLRGGIADNRVVEESVQGVDVVFHLAINWDGATWTHKLPLASLFDVNVRGTLNLLEAAKAHGTKHFILSSSAAVYGQTERTIALKHGAREEGVDEESACRPELWDGDPGPAYAIMKLTTEKLCLMYYHHYGLPVTIFRLEYVFVGENELRDYANIHVDDVVSAFTLSALNKKAYGQVFNLAYPTSYISVKKLQRTLGWKPNAARYFSDSAI